MSDSEVLGHVDKKKISNINKNENLFGAVFLTTIAGASITVGFTMALALAKKKDPTFYIKGILPTKKIPESGGSLALRALGWGSLYALSGFGLFCFGVWKLSGAHTVRYKPLQKIYFGRNGRNDHSVERQWIDSCEPQLEEFRMKFQSLSPFAKVKKESEGRSDFKSVRELINYLIEEDKKNK